jgi:hypothetical protein
MIRADVKDSVGQYLSELMETELTGFLGRGRYERIEAKAITETAPMIESLP